MCSVVIKVLAFKAVMVEVTCPVSLGVVSEVATGVVPEVSICDTLRRRAWRRVLSQGRCRREE